MHIGEAARRSGLSVKTVRYYSDLGLVPEATRTSAGYRHFDGGAVVRLEFVRTLRELGLDLSTIRRVLENRADLRTVAAAHADAPGASVDFAQKMRSGAPELPDDPTDVQVDAWIELAELVSDDEFRERWRAMGRRSFGTTDGEPTPQLPVPTGDDAMRAAEAVREKAGVAMAAGIDPASVGADAVPSPPASSS